MSTFSPFHGRPLDAHGIDEARALALAVGVHGIYLANALRADQGDAVGLYGRDGLLGCLWFGPRGNLIAVERLPLDPELVADVVHRSRWPWRIALGPAACIDALAPRLSGPPLVHRDQVYYGCSPADAAAAAPESVRVACRADRDRLMTATLELNRTDLNVDPRRVDRRWLRDMVDARIAEGSSLVLGGDAGFASKLDFGSRGAAGTVLEGVFTFPEARGRGFASALVAAAITMAAAPFVCLHVADQNLAARRAYERAGMRECGRCRLLLSG